MYRQIDLPDYRQPLPEAAARLARLKARPVVLDVQAIGKTFETAGRTVTALQGISLEVHQRELVCVIGPSGCGKSTLIRILAGLESPTSGRVMLEGREVREPGPDRGMVFQGYTLFPWLTVQGNVMFGLEIAGRSKREAEAEARQWIEMVGLEAFANVYPYQLSGGMKQRVAIARALANRPHILLMDEPFGALDAQTRAQMQSHLLQIWQHVDVTIVFITHDLDEAVYLADRIVVLDAHPGRISEIIEVPMLQPRTKDQCLDPYFLATRQRVEELIHPPLEASAERLPISRMVPPGAAADCAVASIL
jgi:NitT/TauT family transport system ATP-binding protein